MNRLLTIFAVLILSLPLATVARAEWVVERVASSVWASTDGSDWRDVQAGESFSSKTWIQTGQRGQVIFARGTERIVYRPGTIATLASQGKRTDVGPVQGSVLLSIDPRKSGQTVIQTPHLAAVVLGTVLEVSTTPEGSTVRVDTGRVRVEHGGRRAIVETGQEGVVSSNATSTINIVKAQVTALTPSGSGFGLLTGETKTLPETASSNASGANLGSSASEVSTNARNNSVSNSSDDANANAGNNASGNAGNNASGNAGNNADTGGNGNDRAEDNSANASDNASRNRGNSGNAGSSDRDDDDDD